MRQRCSDGTATSRPSWAGTSSSVASPRSSAPTVTAQRGRRISTTRTRSRSAGSAKTKPNRCSTDLRLALRRHGLHLAQSRQAPERLELDLPDALARETEAAADFFQRLRLGVVEAVPQDQHLTLAVGKRQQCRRNRLRAQRDLDLLLGQRIVARDEVAEHCVLLLADRLVERRRRARRGPDFEHLLDPERSPLRG